jgi:hypothetical protein
MTQFPVGADNSIVVGGYGSLRWLEYEQGAETGAALILPGDLIEFTNPPGDCSVKAGQADSTTILGVARIHPAGNDTPMRGGDRVTPYEESDTIEIVSGPITLMLRVATSEEIQCGEFVQPAAGGEVKAYICGTDNDCQRIAQALESLTQDTEAFQWGMFQLRMG